MLRVGPARRAEGGCGIAGARGCGVIRAVREALCGRDRPDRLDYPCPRRRLRALSTLVLNPLGLDRGSPLAAVSQFFPRAPLW